MITVEGCDNTGKTTLVHMLCKEFPQLKDHPSIGNKHNLNEIAEQAYYQAEDADDNDIWDRSRLISEYVYNPILKGRGLAFPYDVFLKLLAVWLSKPQMLIYCRRPYEKIKATFDEREQLEGVGAHLFDIYVAYDNTMGFLRTMFDVSPVPKYLVEYDYEQDNFDDIKNLVGRYLVEAKGLAEGVVV